MVEPWNPDRDLPVLSAIDADDLALGNACLAVEQDLRAEAWAAIERLLALIDAEPGPLPERISALPDPDFIRAVRRLFSAGSIADPPSPGPCARRPAAYHLLPMHDFRVPILVNAYERDVDTKLGKLCERYGARLFPKVGVKDVVPIRGSGLDAGEFSYAMKAHFDFVLADRNDEALLIVEFDGPRHRHDPEQIRRDQRKDRICRTFLLPIIRAGAPSLQEADHRTLLEWIIEVWFEGKRLRDQKRAMDEDENWDGDPPEIDPDDFNYRTAYAMEDEGCRFAPLDAFREAREHIGRLWGSRVGMGVELIGWYQKSPDGHHVGRLALEVESGAWLVGTGRADLRGVSPWFPGVTPTIVAQDIALLDLSRQLSDWERDRKIAVSREGVNAATAGMTPGTLTWFTLPSRYEMMTFTLDKLQSWGIDTDDPSVYLRVHRSFSDDEEERERALIGEDDW